MAPIKDTIWEWTYVSYFFYVLPGLIILKMYFFKIYIFQNHVVFEKKRLNMHGK